jgi:gliding motility-associated-like protein
MRGLLFCIILLSAAINFVVAQPYTSSPTALFSVPERSGCAPFTVQVNAPSCGVCDIRYSETDVLETFQTSNGVHTYTQPGIYTILLVSGTDNETLTVEVLENTSPKFQIAQCGGNQVSVKILETVYDSYVINYSDGGSATVIPNGTNNHLFTDGSGTKTVTVRGRHTGALDNCNASSQQVTVGTPITAVTINKLTVLDNTSVKLEFNAQPNIQYRIEVSINGSPTFQQVKSLVYATGDNDAGIDTIRNNIRPDDNFYCFRIGTYNPCTNVTSYSNTICSANMDLTVADNENKLNWITSSSGVPSFQVTKLTVPANSSLTFAVGGTTYDDSDIICGTEYCYTLLTNYNNGSQSVSLTKCGVAFSTTAPSAIENASSQVNTDGVSLQWFATAPFTPATFSIFKSQGNAFLLLTTTDQLTLDDLTYRTDEQSCYQVSYVDICGNQSPRSNDICPIVLSGTLLDDNSIKLDWTEYGGWKDGVQQYVIEKYDAQGNLLESIPVNSSLTYTDATEDLLQQVYVYIVKAAPVNGTLPLSNSNTIIIIKNPNLFHPTAFTPNGDALNDIFNVYGQYISGFEMQIFNRWGELMFTTTDLDVGWDGTFKGTEMPEGTYTFTANITDLAGRTFKKSGSILLLKRRK